MSENPYFDQNPGNGRTGPTAVRPDRPGPNPWTVTDRPPVSAQGTIIPNSNPAIQPAPVLQIVGGIPNQIIRFDVHLIRRVDADGTAQIDPSLSDAAHEARKLVRAGLLTAIDTDGVLIPPDGF